MTYPVTPDPNIHKNPNSHAEAQAEVKALQQQMEQLFSQLPTQIVEGVVNAILTALGASPAVIAAADANIQSGYTSIQGLLGTTNTSATTALGNWTSLFTGLGTPNISSFITYLTGLGSAIGQEILDIFVQLLGGSGTGNSIATFTTYIETFFGPTGAWQQLINGVVGATGSPVSSLINDLNYGIGTIDPARLSHVPISAIGNGIASSTQVTPNLVLNGAFTTAGSINTNSDWSWDGSTDHTGVTGSGAAKTTANGSPLLLLSNPMAVSAGQAFSFSGYIKWASLTSTGSPLWLGLQTYLNGSIVSNPVIQSAGSSLAASGGWNLLSGTYTVPAGIDTVRLALNVGTTATAGSVWFDDLSATKTGLMSGTWMTGISGTVAADIQTMVDSLYQTVNGGSSTGNALSTFITSLQTWMTNLFGATTLGTTVQYAALPQITIGGVVNDIESHFQNLVDGHVQALTGGSSTNNPVSAVKPNLLSIPAGNIVGLVGGGTVTFGAVGGGNSTGAANFGSQNITWSHTIGAGDNYVIAGITYYFFSGGGPSSSVTYGGTSMNSLGKQSISESGSVVGYVELFGLANPASGAQTVSATTSQSSWWQYGIAGDSISFSNWSSTTSATTATGSGNPAVTVGSATNHMAVCLFGAALTSSSTCSISAFNKTSRYAVNSVYNSTTNQAAATLLGTAAGAASVAFSATSTNTVYSAIGVDLT